MCQALAKPRRIMNVESHIGYVGLGSHSLTCLSALNTHAFLSAPLDSCLLDPGVDVSLETFIALLISGSSEPGEGPLC